ncbi:MAG: chromosomal replication initiator protein DnaA [Firmicutes bacterium]|nr:chromosomal replication initiator protein DnaA [Bacillota bacterium]
MKKELQNNWEKALPFIQANMTEASYDMWIPQLKPYSFNEEEGIFTLILPDFFSETHVNRYSNFIEMALHEVYGRNISVRFAHSDDVAAAKPYGSNLMNEEIYLNPRYIFSSFVVGSNNQFAWAASQAVADKPGKAYNPLFLYGGSGLGKTHLMHAIGHQARKKPHTNVLYVSSEMFTNEFIKALREGKTSDFREKYRKVDILLIDDIQFIAGKDSTQEEFFHSFNALYESGKQIILTSDRKPKEIKDLEERLVSRFEWGLMADIQPPEYETRMAILQKKAEQEFIPPTEDLMEVIAMIAERIPSNIRELEGAFNRVIAYASLTGQPVKKSIAKEALRDMFTAEEVVVTPALIKKQVAKHYGIKVADLDSSKRSRDIAYPRQIAMYLCREMTGLSYPNIGEAFGGRDHTTVMHACEKIASEMRTNDSLKVVISGLEHTIREE